MLPVQEEEDQGWFQTFLLNPAQLQFPAGVMNDRV